MLCRAKSGNNRSVAAAGCPATFARGVDEFSGPVARHCGPRCGRHHHGDRSRLSKSAATSLPWPPGVQKVPDDSPALSPAEALKTFYMPPGYHLELVASEPLVQDPDRHRLGRRGPAVGRRDARLRAGPRRAGAEHGSDRPRRRARGHRQRRHDGQADGLRRRPRARPVAEGARSRRARRRAAERLADARHERRSAHGHEGARHRPVRPARGARRAERERFPLGARQLDAHRRQRHLPAVQERQVRGRRRRCRAASGA